MSRTETPDPAHIERWSGALSRITRHEAVEVDDLAGAHDARRNPVGRAILPDGMPATLGDTPFRSEESAPIGFRITEVRDDLAAVAMKLTCLALEKGAEIIVLNHLPYSGLERFGFRCERVTGDTPEAIAACEEQICRFWNIDLII